MAGGHRAKGMYDLSRVAGQVWRWRRGRVAKSALRQYRGGCGCRGGEGERELEETESFVDTLETHPTDTLSQNYAKARVTRSGGVNGETAAAQLRSGAAAARFRSHCAHPAMRCGCAWVWILI